MPIFTTGKSGSLCGPISRPTSQPKQNNPIRLCQFELILPRANQSFSPAKCAFSEGDRFLAFGFTDRFSAGIARFYGVLSQHVQLTQLLIDLYSRLLRKSE